MEIQRAEADEKNMENKTSTKPEGETRRNLLVGGSKKSVLFFLIIIIFFIVVDFVIH